MLYSPNLPFVIGNDICRVTRIRRILKGRRGPQFVRRILRTEEIQHPTTARILRILDHNAQGSQDAKAVPNMIDGASFTRAVEFMAGRFAAKEAVIKAHPHRRLTFQCIAILRTTHSPEGSVLDASGREREPAMNEEGMSADDKTPQSGPLVALIKPEEEDGADRDVYASVSISHDTEYATAVCLGINPAAQLMWGPGKGS
ncbi:hypothetical protein F4803DRAFT_553990 [Xylaria telfairii]|nr:hypothetical protein F4803DRAFT_553990 [Xylaria telfairii]